MKKAYLIGKFPLLLVTFIIIATYAFGGHIVVTENGSNSLTLKENSYALLTLNNQVSDIRFVRVKTNEGIFTLLNVKEYGYRLNVGEPKLPVIKKLIEVPIGATFEIKILSKTTKEINLSDFDISDFVIPAQPPLSKSIDNPEDIEFIYNKAAYQVNDYVGSELVNVVDLGVMRGVRLARVEISPILYNPVQNKLKVFDNIEVQIEFKGGNKAATIQQKENYFSPFFQSIYKQVFNYKPLNPEQLIMDEPVTYVIVSDPMFEAALQPFIEWKTQKGFHVIEAYTDDPAVGNTTTSIKNYLQDLFDNPAPGVNPQSFVLFVGDVAQIPAFNGTPPYNHVTDLSYCTYDGAGDIYPEAFSGRFSAANLTQLQPQIDKTLEYEQYLMPDPSFLDEVLLVVGQDEAHEDTWGNGQMNYGAQYYFNAAHGLNLHLFLQDPPMGNNGVHDSIIANMNNGISFGNYSAHCSSMGWADPGFTIGDIGSLTNAHKYPLLVGNCCSSVAFDVTCFGEEILRAVDKGALGYIGGSNSTYWDEDYWWGVGYEPISANPVYNPDHLGAYDRLFHDTGEPLEEWYVTQGQMSAGGNLAVTQSGSGMEVYYWEIYHLMGDPSLMIYFGQPPETTANYQGLMPLASTSFTVNTDPYGYVAISKDGVLHGCAIADETGLAEVTMFLPITEPGEADVIITGQNLKPYMGTVTVASPTGAYVLFNELQIDDSNGNNNGLVDFSEYIMLDITLENLGSQTATNVVATLSTTDDNVVINSDTHNWPDILSGGILIEVGAFAFTVNELVPDQHIVQLDMEITDGTDTWNSSFNITLNSPVLAVLSYTIDDSNGNSNGRLDPGETANIIVPNLNDGGCDALNTLATAVAAGSLITINNATFDLETIASGEIKNAVFNVTVDASAQIGDIVNVSYTVESDPYSANEMLMMNIGLVIEDFESGNFETYNWEFGGNANWVIDEVDPYEGVYSAKSGTINHNQTSLLYITIEVTTDDQISFFRKVSSESGWDFLKFYIDDNEMDSWSGELAWEEFSYPVAEGEHTFKWEYFKDGSVSNGEDCVWIDYIMLPAFASVAPLSVNASGTPTDICIGESSQLNTFVMGGTGNYTYEWTPEDGLSDPTISNPVATPDETTTYYVVVNDGDATVTDDVTINVHPIPETPVVMQQGLILISTAASGNQWYNSAGIITGATNQSYAPIETDDYYVIVTNEYGCVSEQSNIYHFIYTGVVDIIDGQQFNIYPNPFKENFTLEYSVKSVSKVKISIYNTIGQQMTILQDNAAQIAGNHRINFDASKLEPGIYYCKIETDDYTIVKRIIHSN
ncbi:MAG: T9SS type A sorting domain-containing protein [Bacteroidales bacterium]|nr:T9SS type A sorting domain-containing protein [Bacteroidales bacterium]